MTTPPHSDDRAGWEHIYRSGDIPPRYRTLAAPNETVVEWAETLPPGAFVLDVGCGVGRHVVYLGERGFRIAGLDVSPTGIQLTQEACAQRQITFDGQVSSMTALTWADSTFDAALSTSVIHHNLRAGIVQTLAEVRRVLKPGGLFLVDLLNTARPDYQWLREQVAAGEITEVEPNTFVDERPHSPDSDGFLPHHYSDEADARDLLRPFELIRMFPGLRPSKNGTPEVVQWVAWVRKPPSD